MKPYLIFDLDGTLLDSMEAWSNLGSNYIRSLGQEPKEDLDARLNTLSLEEGAALLQQEYGLTLTEPQILKGTMDRIRHQYEKTIPAKPGVVKMIKQWYDNGIRMCIATATDRSVLIPALERLHILPYMEFIITCEEVGAGKTSPRIYEEALRGFGARKEEAAVFEDAYHAIETLAKADFDIVGVCDASAAPDRDAIRKLCGQYINQMEEYH